MFGNCFYACSWRTSRPAGRPGLLERCTVDVVKRYRNHPSLLLYMSMDEATRGRGLCDVRGASAASMARVWIPSAYFRTSSRANDATAKRFAHFRDDLPTGMND